MTPHSKLSTVNSLRIIFMGTPDFAVPALKELIDSPHEVVAVYTQPPRPKGRGQKVQPSPVHEAADAHNIPVFTPKSLRKDEAARVAFAAHTADVAVVAAYGLLLPLEVLKAPKYGCLNVHASLLPRWRGASPIQHAIWAGDAESGISIMQMEEGLDTGPVLAKRVVPIRPETTAQSLHDELAGLGAALMLEVLERIAAGKKLTPEKQDDSTATYAPLLTKEHGRIDWRQTAAEIDRQIRALNPWPGVWTMTADDKRLKIIGAELVDETFTEPPGTITDRLGHVACGGDTCIRLKMIQPENAKAMDVISAFNGGYLAPDEMLS
jgi:methionyl-tRNA formyltransferase